MADPMSNLQAAVNAATASRDAIRAAAEDLKAEDNKPKPVEFPTGLNNGV